MRALADFRAGVMQHHTLDLAVAVDLDLCPAVLLVAEGEADVLEAGGKAATADRGPWTVHRFPSSVLIPAKLLCRRLNTLHHADRARRRCAHAHCVAIPQRVLQAELHRVHAKFFGELVHLHLGHEQGLRRAKAAEGRAGDIVGVNAVYIRFDVGDGIGSAWR